MNATDELRQTSQSAVDKIDSTRRPIADALEGAATTVRQHGRDFGGSFEEVASRTAAVLGTTAGYLRSHDVHEIVDDVDYAVRANPVPSLIAAAGAGFLLGIAIFRKR